MPNDLQVKQANTQECKADQDHALQYHHTRLKFEYFKLSVAQLAQRGQVKGHALNRPIGVGVMRPSLWRKQNEIGHRPQQSFNERRQQHGPTRKIIASA
jgi:hypothetical protein